MLTPNVLQMSPIGRVGSARSVRARASFFVSIAGLRALLSPRPRRFQSRLCVLDHVVALELGKGGHNVKEQLAGGGVGIDALMQTPQLDAFTF